MKRLNISLSLIAIVALLVGMGAGCSPTETETDTSALFYEETQPETNQQDELRINFETQARADLDTFNDEAAALEAEYEQLDTAAREEYRDAMEEMRQARIAANDAWGRLEQSSAQAYETVRQEFIEATNGFQQELRELDQAFDVDIDANVEAN